MLRLASRFSSAFGLSQAGAGGSLGSETRLKGARQKLVSSYPEQAWGSWCGGIPTSPLVFWGRSGCVQCGVRPDGVDCLEHSDVARVAPRRILGEHCVDQLLAMGNFSG